jgi:transmembrane sensor
MTEPKQTPTPLGAHTNAAFERVVQGRTDLLDAADRAEVEDFWDWLGTFERPEIKPDIDVFEPLPFYRSKAMAAIAASLVVLLIAAGYFAMRPAETYDQRYVAARGERRLIRLEDGSVVQLGATTRIDVGYTKDQRRIRLSSGQALFEVAHNPSRPFIVEVPQGEVRAIGTEFDVRLDGEAAEVTVVSGKIRVSTARDGSGKALVKEAVKGQQIRFEAERAKRAKVSYLTARTDVNVDEVTAWTHGLLYFNGEPLSEVIGIVNRYSRDEVILTDGKLAELPVFGVIHQGDVTAIRDLVTNGEAITIQKAEPDTSPR